MNDIGKDFNVNITTVLQKNQANGHTFWLFAKSKVGINRKKKEETCKNTTGNAWKSSENGGT